MRTINSFAAAVHRWRRIRGLSLGEVATAAGYSSSYLSKMLHGHRPLLPAAVREIDAALDAGGELERIAAEQQGGGAPPPSPMQLPSVVADFVGRERYLHQLDEALATQKRPGVTVTVVIEGGFWVGKTALAVQWAARVRHNFPGGCLFADLHGLSPGTPSDTGQVLDGFLLALGAGGDGLRGTLDQRAARFRSLLAERPAVVVLDNVADYTQVRPLLPGAGSVVVITSREHQASLLLHTGALHVELGPMTEAEALALFGRHIGEARAGADPESAASVVRYCARLPMAVLIASEHIRQRGQSLRQLAEQLVVDRTRLSLFTSPDPSIDVQCVIDLSYLALPLPAARMFRLLGACPTRTIGVEAAAALAGLDVTRARAALDQLRHAHLIDRVGGAQLRMNPLVRAFALQQAETLENPAEVDRARGRVFRWYAATAWSAGNAMAPDWADDGLAPAETADIEPLSFTAGSGYDAAMAWCEAEADAMSDIVRHTRDYAVWTLPAMFLPYFYVAKKWDQWISAASEGLAAARTAGSSRGVAWSLHSLGRVMHELGRGAEAVSYLSEAKRLFAELGEERMCGWASFSLAAAFATMGRYEEAKAAYLHADTLFACEDFDFGVAFTRAMLAAVHQELGEQEEAMRCAAEALIRAQTVSSKPVAGLAHQRLGLLLLQQQKYRPALRHFDAALSLRRAARERWAEAESLIAKAEALTGLQQAERSREAYAHAASILGALGDPRALDIQARMATIDLDLPRDKLEIIVGLTESAPERDENGPPL